MSESSSRPERPAPREDQQNDTDAEDAGVPVIPVWLSDWVALILGPAALVALLAIVGFGQAHGAVYGWVLLAVAVCVTAALWGWGYSRRRQAAQARSDRSLCGRLEMAAVDRMSGGQFEKYCEDLLPHCGYPGARRVGHLKGQQAVDVTARTRAVPVKLNETSGHLVRLWRLLGLDGCAGLVDPDLRWQGRG